MEATTTGDLAAPAEADVATAETVTARAEAAKTKLLALGGHDFTSGPPDRAISELILRLAAARARGRPRICILPTAGEDASGQVSRFYAAFGERSCDPSDLSLFRFSRPPAELADHLLAQDLIYVGGGSLLTLLALWELHELGAILSLAWRRGIVLAGQGAGAMCWFEAGITKASGRPKRGAGLGLMPGSLCVHYDNDPERRDAYLSAVGNGMPSGFGLDDYAGLLWEGDGEPSALTARRGARAYRVSSGAEGVVESALPARFLPAPAPAALREDIAEYRRIIAMRKRAGWLG
ncbi:MAG: Type 1 glutamine amidotransferase-like domain-containing protein [Solirubrobacterales bacterium]